MRSLAFSFVVLALVETGTAADSPAQSLEGTYQAAAIIRDGKAESAAIVNSTAVKIAADELTFTIKDKMFPAKIKVNVKAAPAAIDISPADGPEKGKTFLGIYKVENGELLIAFAERGERPTAFKGEEGVLLIRLKKEAKK